MSDMKQVKVDNWGIYFLQRLKHFFNRTDYCDLTLQFQDNAQLKVHRLVLNACTEYFELLERTCEMYEDCLVMPDDLQADVVVPIVNFMYTGQLGFKPELLERLYQTAQVMNMPVLTKLLDAHRNQMHRSTHDYQNLRSYSKSFESSKQSKPTPVASTSYMGTKRSYSKAFDNTITSKIKKQTVEKTALKPEVNLPNSDVQPYTYSQKEPTEYPIISKKPSVVDPRPTRYELPEELDGENIFDNSFTSISYGSTPLMVHPETVKRYSSKKSNIFDDTSNTKRFIRGTSTVDIVECKKISSNDNIFDDVSENIQDDIFPSNSSKGGQRDPNQLFDLILDNDVPKATIEIKDSESTKKPKIDHAKIISDVLKKYPHLVKSNKNIKLRVLDAPIKSKKLKLATSVYQEEKDIKPKTEVDCTFDIDVLESKDAAKLIAMGVENVKGPWICLICGTPGRAITFTTYYKFRRHLVEVHNEKPIVNMCEYCGLKSLKRNYLLHHLYTKHGVPPPSPYHFPKCNHCNYIALSEALLVKHKSTHVESRNFGCNVCTATFSTSSQLLTHIQKTGHKYSAERKTILHCIYCLKTFSRETNLYTHLKIHHKQSAQSDKIIDESDDERDDKRPTSGKSDITKNISLTYANEYENIDVKYQIQQKPDGNIQVLTKSPQTSASGKHKILNPSFNSPTKSASNTKISLSNKNKQEVRELKLPSKIINKESDEIIVINGSEYIIKDNQLIPRTQNTPENDEYLLSNIIAEQSDDNLIPTTSIEIPIIHHTDAEDSKMIIKKPMHMNEPIEIVVSSEEQYKALMSSTHSIIFEEPSKALTVLTAPQTSTLEGSTIDLDNTQPNDMMIIQENFPLSVTETVSTDNNNIVVVYSHPVDDPCKQFQYIPSQGIEAQFIQSSAMVTHNYDTVTTSTPVMSAHILDTQVNESWQNSIKENVQSVPIELHLQQHVEIKNSKQSIENPQNSSDNIQTIQDIPSSAVDASLITTDLSSIEETTTQTCLDNTNNTIAVSVGQVLINEATSMPTINLNITEPNEQLVHKEIQTESMDVVCPDQVNVSDNNIKNKNNEQLNIDEKNNENIIVLQQKVEEIDINSDVNTSIAQDASVLQQNLITEKVMNSGSHNVEVSTNKEVIVTKAGKEQLLDLTAEWTEVDNDKLVADNVDTNVTDGSAYIEESIENIQQEMAKQLETITTESNTVKYNEPLTTPRTIQPEIENGSAIKELDTDKKTSSLGLDDSELATGDTDKKLCILNNDKGNNMSLLPPTTVESASTNIKGELSNDITKNVEIASEKFIQNNVVAEVESIIIHSENVIDPADTPEASPQSNEILRHETEDKIEEDTSSLKESHPRQQQPVISLNNKAREKINTILNDWDDNDSQDDSKNESDLGLGKENDEIVQVEIVQEVEIAQEKVPVKGSEISNEKIKSIVSDWDDDDEDESK